jgi:hypothetical protein
LGDGCCETGWSLVIEPMEDHPATPPELRERKAWATADAKSVMSFRRSSVASLVQPDAVIEWRRGRLVAAGCARGLAAPLAWDPQLELHAVLELLDRACSPELAARIVAPLDDDGQPC